jgi:phenylacetaldehyde dehydrogenase
MLVLKLGPALAAGCTIVLKPAELTPLLAIRFMELVQEAGFPAGVINLVQGYGEDVGRAIVRHRGVDKIAFTGSTEVGKQIVRDAADDLKRVTLELGGKSPFIVFPDADLAEAIPAAAMACFALSGQNCMAGTRLFVAEEVHDAFVDGLKQVATSLPVGDGMIPETLIGPLISAEQRKRVLGFVERAQEAGAEVVAGGGAVGERGYFVAPTVCAGVTADMELAQQEVFGPVLAVLRFSADDEDAVMRQVNSTTYGLSGSVWTRDLSRAHLVAARVDSGQVAVNAHAAVSPETPFGGNRQSGWGREFGREGLDAYLKTKAVSVKLASAPPQVQPI